MTKTTKTAVNEDAVSTIKETIESVQEKTVVPVAAREFLARTAATAKERAETVHETAAKFNSKAETAVVSMIGRYAAFNKGLLDMTMANVEHALVTVEKVSAAKSLTDAVQIQADYVRESAKVNYDRVRDAAEVARTTVSDAASSVRETAVNAWPYGKKAA